MARRPTRTRAAAVSSTLHLHPGPQPVGHVSGVYTNRPDVRGGPAVEGSRQSVRADDERHCFPTPLCRGVRQSDVQDGGLNVMKRAAGPTVLCLDTCRVRRRLSLENTHSFVRWKITGLRPSPPSSG